MQTGAACTALGAGDDRRICTFRNAISRGDGRFSNLGPCGGAAAFGANGVNDVTAGSALMLRINYDGGNEDAANEFEVRYACGAESGATEDALRSGGAYTVIAPGSTYGNTAALESAWLSASGSAYPVAAADGNQEAYYEVGVLVPAAAAGLKCTYSMVDQRDWGGCLDLNVLPVAPADPWLAPHADSALPGADVSEATYDLVPTSSASSTTYACDFNAGSLRVNSADDATASVDLSLTIDCGGTVTQVAETLSLSFEDDFRRRYSNAGSLLTVLGQDVHIYLLPDVAVLENLSEGTLSFGHYVMDFSGAWSEGSDLDWLTHLGVLVAIVIGGVLLIGLAALGSYVLHRRMRPEYPIEAPNIPMPGSDAAKNALGDEDEDLELPAPSVSLAPPPPAPSRANSPKPLPELV